MTPTLSPPALPVSALTSAVFACFEPSPDVARFIVPDGVSVDAALRSLPNDGHSYRPSSYVFDPKTRIVQFGPDVHPEFGNLGMICEQPVAELKRVLRARRLPPTLVTSANLPPVDARYDEAVRCLLSAFMLINGTASVVTPDAQTLALALQKGSLAILIRCSLENEDVRLFFETWLTLVKRTDDNEGAVFTPGRNSLTDGVVNLRADLLRDSDRNSLDGYRLLRAGLKRLLGPLVSGDGVIVLKPLDGHPFASMEISFSLPDDWATRLTIDPLTMGLGALRQ